MKYLLAASIVMLMSQCSKIWQDDELSIQRTPYTGNQLRTDGYYYQLVGSELFSLYFFYNNSLILYAGGAFSSTQEANKYIEKELLINKSHQKHKEFWGVFDISDNKIEFERWYPSNSYLKSFVRSGIILNDTTFLITSSRRSGGNDPKEQNETYHFKQFSPKPDSTNSFIK